MEPIAVGFLVLIGTAALIGVVVGAIGAAVVWRTSINIVLGGVLTACALPLVLVATHRGDHDWLHAELTWGAPAMTVSFLVGSVSACWLEVRTTMRPAWVALAAFGIALGLGLVYLLLFRLSPKAPLVAAPAAAVCLILLLIRGRRLARIGRTGDPGR